MPYDENDLKVAEALGGLKTAINDLCKKNDAEHQELKSLVGKMFDGSANCRLEMQAKIDRQNGLIKWIMGVGTGVVTISGILFALFKTQ